MEWEITLQFFLELVLDTLSRLKWPHAFWLKARETAGTKCSLWRILRKKTLHTNNRELKKLNTMIEFVNYATVTFMKAEVVTQVWSILSS